MPAKLIQSNNSFEFLQVLTIWHCSVLRSEYLKCFSFPYFVYLIYFLKISQVLSSYLGWSKVFLPVMWNIKPFQCFERRLYISRWLELLPMNVWKLPLLCLKVSPFSWIRPAGGLVWCEACFMPPPDIVGHFRTLRGHCWRDTIVGETILSDWQPAFWCLGHHMSPLSSTFHCRRFRICEECSKRTLHELPTV